MSKTVEQRIEDFKTDLEVPDAVHTVRKLTLSSSPYAMPGDAYFDLKVKVAREFDIHPSEVALVGSAQLGFSIVPGKRYRHFGDDSDIDVAIISPRLFECVWQLAFDYWRENQWWPQREKFIEYLFRGWIRPDKLPPAERFAFCRRWWEFFNELTRSGRFGQYKISAGLYRSWHFFECYHGLCVQACIDALEMQATSAGEADPENEEDRE